jgi:hypothetical protein
MSIERHRRNRIPDKLGLYFGMALLLLGFLVPQCGNTATTERIVTDPTTGLAISGFDPVAYFVDSAAKFGKPDIEQIYGGTIWRFRNIGNKAAFVAHPEVYMPRYGGYDPVALGHGKVVPGHPLQWLIKNQRLYLFDDAHSRAEFAAGSERILFDADRQWPAIEHALTP